jgi:HD domain
LPILEDAILLATQMHRGQRDKAGEPYILHALRVMLRMQSPHEMMAAVLHDTVEDTPVTLADLEAAGYPREVVAAIDALSARDGETYDAFIDRVRTDPIARRVKIGDLEDNMDLRRIRDPQDSDLRRLVKYRRYWALLTADVSQGP